MHLDRTFLTTIAHDACSAVFASYGVLLERQEPPSDPEEPLRSAGIVGYHGRSVRGACLVAATANPFVRSAPRGLDGERLEEWVAELTNELGGRIKNRLIAEGVRLSMSLPVVLDGEHLARVTDRRSPPLAYTSDDGSVFLWIDVVTGQSFTLEETRRTMFPEGVSMLWDEEAES